MTQAQKTAKAKFKQAIAYRQKTGVSLKEAFAHIYGKKKVGAVKKKSAPKKKVAKKKVAKKVVKKKYSLNKKKDKLYSAKKPGKRIAKKSGKTYYENRPNRSDKGKLLGIESNLSMSLIKRLEDINKEIEKRQDVIANVIQNKTYFVNKNGKSWYPKFMKLAKSHIAELKKHKIEIKKLV
jgi:hypothetical protein